MKVEDPENSAEGAVKEKTGGAGQRGAGKRTRQILVGSVI
jgi:hypothetical protein